MHLNGSMGCSDGLIELSRRVHSSLDNSVRYIAGACRSRDMSPITKKGFMSSLIESVRKCLHKLVSCLLECSVDLLEDIIDKYLSNYNVDV